MIQPGWGGVLLAVVLSSFGAGVWKGCDLERDRWQDRLSQVQDSLRRADSTVQKLRQDSAVLASTHRTDTLRLTEILTRWRTLRDTLTVATTDTLTVERVIYLADSTIAACEASWRGCEALRANAEDRAAQYQKQIDGLTRQLAKPPSWWKRPQLTLPLGIGLGLAGALLLR
jgi:chromosome segregation ATPase